MMSRRFDMHDLVDICSRYTQCTKQILITFLLKNSKYWSKDTKLSVRQLSSSAVIAEALRPYFDTELILQRYIL
jgi:hypothetical protein